MKRGILILIILVLCVFLFEDFIFNFTGRAIDGCQPDWQPLESDCDSETNKYLLTYQDSNDCETEEGKPENKLLPCLGNLKYTDENSVEILTITKEDRTPSAKFAIPGGVNIPNLIKADTITRQSKQSSFGFVIIKDMPYPKIVYVDKISPSSEKVCVKDAQVDSINDFSLNCNGESEFLLNCPSVYSYYSCEIKDNLFEIHGLENSAVKEIVSGQEINITNGQPSCIPNWVCSDWSACADGIQIRNCIDTNFCGVQDGKPQEEMSCENETNTGCNPYWVCSDFGKCENGMRTRECNDVSSCGTDQGKPIEQETCKETTNSTIIYYLIIFILFILISLDLIFIYLRFKKMNSEEENNLFKFPQKTKPDETANKPQNTNIAINRPSHSGPYPQQTNNQPRKTDSFNR